MILGIFQQLLLIATAVGFSQEVANNNFNKSGLLKYSRSSITLIAAKVFPYLFMSLWILGGDYLLAIYFGMMSPEHPWLLLSSALLMVMGACMMGTLFSILISLPLKATQVLMSFAAPAITLSGFTWPTEYIPAALNVIGDIIPLTPFLRALELIWIEGASFDQVLPEINHQLILIAVYTLLSILLLKKKIKKHINRKQ